MTQEQVDGTQVAEPEEEQAENLPTEPEKQGEDYDAKLQEAIAKVKAESEEKYKSLQRVIDRKDKEIKKLSSQPVQSNPSTQTLKKVVEELEANRDPLDPPNPRIVALKAEIAQLEREETTAKQLREMAVYSDQWKDKLVQKIEAAGLDPESDIFDDVWENYELHMGWDGRFEVTDKKLDKVLKGVSKEMPEKNPEVDVEKLVEARLKEEKRKWMEENGLLEKETGLPSGGTKVFTRKQIAEMPPPEFKKNYATIKAAQLAGNIK